VNSNSSAAIGDLETTKEVAVKAGDVQPSSRSTLSSGTSTGEQIGADSVSPEAQVRLAGLRKPLQPPPGKHDGEPWTPVAASTLSTSPSALTLHGHDMEVTEQACLGILTGLGKELKPAAGSKQLQSSRPVALVDRGPSVEETQKSTAATLSTSASSATHTEPLVPSEFVPFPCRPKLPSPPIFSPPPKAPSPPSFESEMKARTITMEKDLATHPPIANTALLDGAWQPDSSRHALDGRFEGRGPEWSSDASRCLLLLGHREEGVHRPLAAVVVFG